MKTVVFEVPTMYGDHHVLEVRRLLLQMDGVVDVYASSGFQIVEVTFDENQQTPAALEACLSAAGYLG
jgi:copper chaperone CopZ